MKTITIGLSSIMMSISTADHFVDPKLLDIPEIKRMEGDISNSYLLKHNFLRCFENGDFANMTDAASIFALNHYVYSKNFINYLQTVANKIENQTISKPILENINEELGNYEQEDIDTLSQMGIQSDWYNRIPHKFLSQRFFESVGIDASKDIPVVDMDDEETLVSDSVNQTPGELFTRYMIDLYRNTNACESLAIIGFAIEETVSRLYQYIWSGLQNHTPLTGDQIVFFPLHILIDDGHADLLKLGFKHYLLNSNSMCAQSEDIINDVLQKRIKMYDDVRKEIEERQGYDCKLPHTADDSENTASVTCTADAEVEEAECQS